MEALAGSSKQAGGNPPVSRSWTCREVLFDPLFWILLSGVLAPALIGTTIFFHQDYLTELRNWPARQFAMSLSIMAVTTVVFALVAGAMVDRVLNDQKEDGSWSLWEPDWDVHACFDALFILRQLGDPKDPRITSAFNKATDWILTCRKSDGGFAHFPDQLHSDMDAVYFHVGALAAAGHLAMSPDLENEEILGWGHAMNPDETYSCLAPAG